jgi:uncharacterized protein YndB with AHSA1/START domain
MNTAASKDRIETKATLKAPAEKVWSLLTDPQRFGDLFQFRMDPGTFVPGARLTGTVTHPGYEGVPVELSVEQVEPPKRLTYRWHPYAVERGHDYSAEPKSLVSFELHAKGKETEVTVVESGFRGLPPERREPAHSANTEGWPQVMKALEGAVSRAK